MQFGFSTGRDLCRSEGGEKSAGQGQPQQASRRSGQNRRYQNTELQSKVEQASNRTQQCSSICASSRTQIGANPRCQMHCQPNQVVLGSSKTSRDIERPTSNCSERKKLLRLFTYYFIEPTHLATVIAILYTRDKMCWNPPTRSRPCHYLLRS